MMNLRLGHFLFYKTTTIQLLSLIYVNFSLLLSQRFSPCVPKSTAMRAGVCLCIIYFFYFLFFSLFIYLFIYLFFLFFLLILSCYSFETATGSNHAPAVLATDSKKVSACPYHVGCSFIVTSFPYQCETYQIMEPIIKQRTELPHVETDEKLCCECYGFILEGHPPRYCGGCGIFVHPRCQGFPSSLAPTYPALIGGHEPLFVCGDCLQTEASLRATGFLFASYSFSLFVNYSF